MSAATCRNIRLYMMLAGGSRPGEVIEQFYQLYSIDAVLIIRIMIDYYRGVFMLPSSVQQEYAVLGKPLRDVNRKAPHAPVVYTMSQDYGERLAPTRSCYSVPDFPLISGQTVALPK